MRRPGLALAAAAVVLAVVQPAAASSTPSQVGLVSFTAASLNSSGEASLTLDWPSASNARTYEIFKSTSYDMTSTTKYTSTGSARTITGLRKGKDYFFQVRGVNGSTVGARSQRVGHTTIRAQGAAAGPTYRVMSYNVCSRVCAGWSTRSSPVADRVTTYSPDVLAAQEADYLTAPSGYTQAYYKSGKRMFYSTVRFDFVRAGEIFLGHHGGGDRWAVWVELADKSTGQHVIFTDVHTVSGDTTSAALDRKAEVTTLISGIASANPAGLPVVYAGDFNSHKNRSNDYVADVFHGVGFYDAFDLATKLTRQHYNTYNAFDITPRISYKWGDHVDHVWVDPTASRVTKWSNGVLIVSDKLVTPIPSDHSPLIVDVQVN